MNKTSTKKGISLSDLVAGKLVEIEVTDVQQTQSKNGEDTLVIVGRHNDSTVNLGIIGNKGIEAFLSHSEERDGNILTDIPESHATPEMSWINAAY